MEKILLLNILFKVHFDWGKIKVKKIVLCTIMAAKVQNVWISAKYSEYRNNAKRKYSM